MNLHFYFLGSESQYLHSEMKRCGMLCKSFNNLVLAVRAYILWKGKRTPSGDVDQARRRVEELTKEHRAIRHAAEPLATESYMTDV